MRTKGKAIISGIERLPPHSLEAEQGVLGCMITSPNGCITQAENKLGREGEPLYDLRHRDIFTAIIGLHDRNVPVDTITLMHELREHQKLESVGGIQYLSSLPDATPSALNLPNYLDIVHEKFVLRRLIHRCTDVVGSAYETQGDLQGVVTRAQADLLSLLNPIGKSTTQEHWSIKDLLGYDVDHDPNAVIGWKDGRTTRYLCRGYGAWIIGASGLGKSTLGQQMVFMFSIGKPFCGITPVRPLRCLIIQNENDQGDCSEATQGILDCAGFTPQEFDLLNQNVKVIRCRGKTGEAFCRFLEREVIAWRADLVYVDPLLRFAGIDVSKQDQCTKFLNDHLDPVLANTGVVLLGAHHTGKPKNQKETQHWTIYDYAYAGIGSSELVNWARAITILRVLPDGVFEMMLAKRGLRAWATHPDSLNPTTSIYLRHDPTKIYWRQINPEEVPEQSSPKSSKTAGGRKNLVQDIASRNLHAFCAACPPEGEALRAIARRLEAYLASQKIDVRQSTAIRAVAALVANSKLTKTPDGLYIKGDQA